ncbi:MAG: hypothetical protein ACUVX8_06820 [Candidatus Zipacnadales bacterium]
MTTKGAKHLRTVAAMFAVTTFLMTYAFAMEVQLAGIRLDASWVNVLDVYGCPAGVVVYGGTPQATGGTGAMGMGGGMMGEAMMGMGGGMGLMGAPMGGGMMGAPMGGSMMGAPMGGGMEGMGMGGAMAGGGAMGGAMGGAGGGGGPSGWPMWALPVWVVLEEGEVEWFYQKGDVVLGFVFNRDGYVRAIAVAGESCDYARTALWRPHRYVKLGDDFKRVLYRYGYPDEVTTFNADATVSGGGGGVGMAGGAAGPMGAGMEAGAAPGAGMPGGEGGMMMGAPMGGGMMGGPMGGAMMGAGMGGAGAAGAQAVGSVSVNFAEGPNVFSRDCELTYDDNNNIAFTLHNMKVVRIYIWKSGTK